MSCPGDNYPVPGANPCGGGGGSGVQSVGAGTPNVTITGTATNPLINVTNVGGVTQIEGQIGNVNINGIGLTVAGGVPVLGDITLTADVQNITGSGAAIVTEPTPGTFNIAVPSALVNNITQGAGITVTQPTAGVYNIASVVQNVTGTGGAVVTQPTPGTFQVNAPLVSVNGLTGLVNITADGISQIEMNPGTNNINIATQGLKSLSPGLNVDDVTLTSINNSVTITSAGTGTIDLAVAPINVGVTSFNSFAGPINVVGSGIISVYNYSSSNIVIGAQGVTSLNPGGNIDTVTLVSNDSTVNITNPSAGIINLAVPTPAPVPPLGSPNINVTGNTVSLAYDTTTAGKFSVQGPIGIGYTIAAGSTANFIITLGEALSYAFLTQKGINPLQGFFCVNFNIGMRTLLNANTNPGARLNIYLKNKNAGIGSSTQDLILATTNYQAGFEPTVYCNFFLGSFQVTNANILPNYDPNTPQLSLYVENQFSTDIRLNYVADKGWGYITQNNRRL